jgi:AcrR family transcriptional regulator
MSTSYPPETNADHDVDVPGIEGSTRERLLRSAIRLFAENGFAGTTVGDIERDAGLTPRGGGFYRHFESKEDVLTAAVDAQISQSDETQAALSLLPFSDLRSELTIVCRWLLGAIDGQRHLLQVVEREGDRFPELLERCRLHLVDAVHRAAVEFTTRWAEKTGHPSRDPEASAVLMIGAALNYRRTEWIYGEPTLGVGENRFVDTWVNYCYDLMTGTSS